MSQPAPELSMPDRLVDAAVEIACARGLAALTARALSGRTGQSPSAVNYHLGGREALVARVQARALEASAEWRLARRAELADLDGAPSWASPAGRVAALVGARTGAFQAWGLLLAELEALAETDATLAGPARVEIAAMGEFWRHVARDAGQGEAASEIWTDLAVGLTGLFLAAEPEAARLPWIVDAAERVRARLAGEAITPVAERTAGAAERLHAEAPTSEGARRILEAAIQVLAERGADRLTQREVAAAAGLSLAAVTYFFRTKGDLVAAAFHELHRQVSLEAMAEASAQGGARLARATLDAEGASAWRLKAMQALQLAAARESSLSPIVRALRATRGATSIGWLRSQGVAADRLDAFVFSTAMGGVVQRARLAAAEDRRAALDAGERRLLAGLFGL